MHPLAIIIKKYLSTPSTGAQADVLPWRPLLVLMFCLPDRFCSDSRAQYLRYLNDARQTYSFPCTASTIHQPTTSTTEEHKRQLSTKIVKRTSVHDNTDIFAADFLDDSNKDVHVSLHISCKALVTLFPDVPHVTDSNSTPANSNCASFRK